MLTVLAVLALLGHDGHASPKSCDKHPENCVDPNDKKANFSISMSAEALSVNQGYHASIQVAIDRNEFAAAVTFDVRGLPAGVTARIPPPSAGNSVTIILDAANGAPPVSGQRVTIIAKPPVGSKLSARSASFAITVKHVYFISSAGAPEQTVDPVPMALSPCTRSLFLIDVVFPKGATGAAQISATSLPSGYKATFNFPTIYAPSGGVGGNVSTLMVLDGITAPDIGPGQSLSIVTVRNGVTSSRKIPIDYIPGRITSISPVLGFTGRDLKPGTPVTLDGQGFCPGSTVTFGNAMATANPTSINVSGTSMVVEVPRLATSGKVSVVNRTGMGSSADLQIDSWRNTNGFSWGNSKKFQELVGGYNLGDLDAIFGVDQTRDPVFQKIPDPLALALIKVLDDHFSSGQCFGMALASAKLQGRSFASTYPSWDGVTQGTSGPPRDSWHFTGPELGNGKNASPALAQFVHRQHAIQTGVETLNQYLQYDAGVGSVLKSDIAKALHEGGALMSLNGDHVLKIINVRSSTRPGETFLIDTYDPNVPFMHLEDTEPNGTTHADRVSMSTVTVNDDQTVHFDDKNGNTINTTVSKVTVFPMSLYVKRPTMLTLPGLFQVIVSGFGFGVAVTQVTDEQGHTLLQPDGSLNTDPATRIPHAKPFPGMGGLPGSPATQMFVASAKSAYTYTLTGKGRSYDARFVAPGYAVELENIPSQVGTADEVLVAPQAAAFELHTAGQKSFQGRLMVRAPDNGVRTASVRGTSFPGLPVRLAFNAARDEVVYTHKGSMANVTLEFSSTKTASSKLVAAPVRVEHGDVVTFRPNWNALEKGAGSVQVRKAAGAVTALPIR